MSQEQIFVVCCNIIAFLEYCSLSQQYNFPPILGLLAVQNANITLEAIGHKMSIFLFFFLNPYCIKGL